MMSFTVKDQQLLFETDEKISAMLAEHCSDDAILIAMLEKLPCIKVLLDSAEPKELDLYINNYPGLYYLIKLLNRSDSVPY